MDIGIGKPGKVSPKLFLLLFSPPTPHSQPKQTKLMTLPAQCIVSLKNLHKERLVVSPPQFQRRNAQL